jgi:hypothetical protein
MKSDFAVLQYAKTLSKDKASLLEAQRLYLLLDRERYEENLFCCQFILNPPLLSSLSVAA